MPVLRGAWAGSRRRLPVAGRGGRPVNMCAPRGTVESAEAVRSLRENGAFERRSVTRVPPLRSESAPAADPGAGAHTPALPTMTPSLTPTDLARLATAADALLSPLACPDAAAWRARVTDAMRALLGIDNALFVATEGTAGGARLRFHCDTAPPAVLQRFEQLTRAEPRTGR